MAQIDASIPLGIRPMQIESPVNQLAKVLQMQNYQQQGELNKLTMDEKLRTIEQDRAYNMLYQNAVKPDGTIDRSALITGAARGGFGSKIPGMQEGFAKSDKALTDAEQAKFTLAKNRADFMGQVFGSVRANPTVETAMMALDALEQSGTFPSEQIAKWRANAQANPASIGPFAEQAFRSALEAKEQLPKYQTNNIGGSTLTQSFDPVTGQARTVNSVQNTVSPDATLQATTSTENNRRSVGAQYANANATREVAAATRDAARIQTGYKSEQDLRKEFEALPETKKYKAALPSFKGIEDAVKRNTTQSDINIVYGIAKIYDPESVVREGEYATVANSPNIPERIKGYAQYLQGGGRLSPQVKKEILDEARSRMKSFEDQFMKARGDYESIAQRTGIDPTRVFPSQVERMQADPGPNGGASGQKGAQALPSKLTPQTLTVGQSYTLPNGKTGRWNGQAFEVSQ